MMCTQHNRILLNEQLFVTHTHIHTYIHIDILPFVYLSTCHYRSLRCLSIIHNVYHHFNFAYSHLQFVGFCLQEVPISPSVAKGKGTIILYYIPLLLLRQWRAGMYFYPPPPPNKSPCPFPAFLWHTVFNSRLRGKGLETKQIIIYKKRLPQ